MKTSGRKMTKHFFFFLLLLIISLLLASFSFVTPLSFTFPNFKYVTNVDNLTYVQSAYRSPDSGIQLTSNEQGTVKTSKVGRVVYNQPFQLWDNVTGALADFITNFTFTIAPVYASNVSSGDGLAFFLAPFPANVIPNNSGGGNLGLFSAPLEIGAYSNNVGGNVDLLNNFNQVVAVEFDTYENYYDPNGSSHIGIDVYSVYSIQYLSFDENKFSLVTKSTANATVIYNAKTMNLTILLRYDDLGLSWSISAIIDLRKFLPPQVAVGFSASTGESTELHTILSWNFSSSDLVIFNDNKYSRVRKTLLVLLITMAGVGTSLAALGLIWFVVWWLRLRSTRKDDVFSHKGWGPKNFNYAALANATNDFDNERKLGAGGFGAVYKGVLPEMNNIEVAIKRISKESMQGKKEYMAEVTIISQLRHRNLVQLIGYCHDSRSKEFLLVYQYMPNRSLDYHLYDQHKLLSWNDRYNIAVGLASALLYLHEDWEQKVIHRDIKPSNVMLDSDFNAKLGDFGLAKLVDHEQITQITAPAGTLGYMAPECTDTGKANKESDVYSFGIVALEISSGRKPIDFSESPGRAHILHWIWDLYQSKALLEAADKRLGSEFDPKMMERLILVGMWCSQLDPKLRPSIRQVIGVLTFDCPFPEPLEIRSPWDHRPDYSRQSISGISRSFSIASKSQVDEMPLVL